MHKAFLRICWLLLSYSGLVVVCAADPSLVPDPAKLYYASPTSLYNAWWGKPPQIGAKEKCFDPGACAKCHPKNLEMDKAHAFSCITCHKGDEKAQEKHEAHAGLVSDPGDLDQVASTCGKCHPKHAKNVKISKMALAPTMINHTRYEFGAQSSSSFLFGVRPAAGLDQIPDPNLLVLDSPTVAERRSEVGENAQGNGLILSGLGDDLLRRSCLRCHLYTKGSSRPGEQRGKGCSACHCAYSNEDSLRPTEHGIVKSPGVTACLKCHNSNHVGCDYVGLFEKDFNRGFRSPIMDGKQSPTLYGAEQHRLTADIHFKSGMVCSDCHPPDQIHGSGKPLRDNGNRQKISCESCHVYSSHPSLVKNSNGQSVLKRMPDKIIPSFRTDIIPHSIVRHRDSVNCATCHAAWSFQDYGYHIMLDERAEYWMWSINAAQNDPQIQELLGKFVGDYAELIPERGSPKPAIPEKVWTLPKTRDWVSGDSRSGAWFKGFTIRRWENPPLGLDSSAKVTIMRPMNQFVVSWVKPDGTVTLDSVVPITGSGKPALIMNPYSPHTIRKKGRQCHACHGNPKSVGLGSSLIGIGKTAVTPVLSPENRLSVKNVRWDALVDKTGNPIQSSSYEGSAPLSPDFFKRLLFPGYRFRSIWSQYLGGWD
ncbi:MAG: hypothetical protein WC647_08025 [Desulfomonilaceae bacterium]